MKRFTMLLSILLLLLTSCGTFEREEIVQPEEEGSPEVSIIPSHSLAEDQYQILLPYRPSAARGAITNQITNRVDIDELEEGLRRHSVDVFSPEEYVFEEGQYLSTDKIFELIDSLNPKIKDQGSTKDNEKEHRNNPRVFSHILEQNFLKRKDDRVELVGLSIGIALKSVYRFQAEEGGPYLYEDISSSDQRKEGERIAEEILKEIRSMEELQNVPVMFALFSEAAQSSPVPGHFTQKTVVKKDESTIGKWETIHEKYVLFPSKQSRDDHASEHQKVRAFSDKIAEYFPNYVGVIGNGFYVDDDLKQLTIEVPIEFYGKGEILGFTQYAYGKMIEIFSNHYDIQISVFSSDGPESLIFRHAGEEEPTVHIFH